MEEMRNLASSAHPGQVGMAANEPDEEVVVCTQLGTPAVDMTDGNSCSMVKQPGTSD